MIIAFDAAKRKTGWAFRIGNQWITGIVSPQNTEKLRAVIDLAKSHGATAAVIEDCYCGVNVRTIKALQDAQTRICVFCELAGLAVTLVYPATWHSAYGIHGKSVDCKRAAQLIASRLGAPNVTEDEADAVCLADYAERIGKQQELVKRGRK